MSLCFMKSAHSRLELSTTMRLVCCALLLCFMVGCGGVEIDQILEKLSITQRIGQMTLTENAAKQNELYSKSFGIGATFDLYTRSCADTIAHLKRLNQRSMSFSNSPVLMGSDAIHGAGFLDGGTLFPHAIGIAATFNSSLAYEAARATATEMRVCGMMVAFGPSADLGVDYRWGRHYETYGDEPALVGSMVDAVVRGLQSPIYWLNSSSPIPMTSACVKHWLGYSMPDNGNDRSDAKIPQWMLERFFVPPFRAAFSAGATSMMLNSGSVNGIAATSNKAYITDLLRTRLGWQDGLAMTDWQGASYMVQRGWHRSIPDATRAIVHAGVDMSMNPEDFADVVLASVPSNITVQRIAQSARRILALKRSLAAWEYPSGFEQQLSLFASERNRLLAREAVQESVVLLKNERNTLPLRNRGAGLKILVTGPAANTRRVLCGAWTVRWQGADDDGQIKHKGATIFEGLRDAIQPVGGQVRYVRGCGFDDCPELGAGVDSARWADVVVVAVGERPYAEGAYNIGDLTLQRPQLDYINALAAVCDRVVVVMVSGRPRLLGPAEKSIDSLLYAFLPGPEAGIAIANILIGAASPNGRLPFSYPSTSTEIGLPLKRYSRNPKWPFGFGLSYTAFNYSNLRVSAENLTLSPSASLSISVDISNIGGVGAKETVLLFMQEPFVQSGQVEWSFVLKKYRKVSLEPGERRSVQFSLRGADWRYHLDYSMSAVLPNITLRVGLPAADRSEMIVSIGVSSDTPIGQIPFNEPDIVADEGIISDPTSEPPAVIDPPTNPPMSPPMDPPMNMPADTPTTEPYGPVVASPNSSGPPQHSPAPVTPADTAPAAEASHHAINFLLLLVSIPINYIL